MEFNPDPTKQSTEVLFSCKKSSLSHPQLIFNGIAVAKVNDQKHLGLILDSRLSFEKHINEKIIKAKKIVGILKHLSRFLPLKTLDHMYKALVRSHLDYCDISYHIPSHQNQAPLGVTLNSVMEKSKEFNINQPLPSLVLGMVQTALNSTRNWDGNHSQIVVWVGVFYRFIKFLTTRLLLT